MRTVIVIPSRYASSRFPGKPLAPIRGHSLLRRTWAIARAVAGVDQVLVATDDPRIEAHARSFGAEAVMTDPACRNGTERVWAAIRGLFPAPGLVINFQGDAVLTPPWVLQPVVDALRAAAGETIVTPAVRLDWAAYDRLAAAKGAGQVGSTTVVMDVAGRALYFSKGLIPFARHRLPGCPPLFQHIGLYGYTRAALERYLELPPSPLEEIEGLEQLRALENGLPIQVVTVDYRGRTAWAVDSPEDVAVVESIIDREGELVPLPPPVAGEEETCD